MTLEMDDGRSLVWEGNLLSSTDDKNAKPMVVYDNKYPALTAEITRFVDAAAGGNQELPTAGPFAAKVFRLLEKLRDFK